MDEINKNTMKFPKHLAHILQNIKSESSKSIAKSLDKNWTELLKTNLDKISMLSSEEKSHIIRLIQKNEPSEEDKKELVSILIKLRKDELNKLFGKSFKDHANNYVQWGAGWYEDPGLKRIVLNNFFKHNLDGRKDMKGSRLLEDKYNSLIIQKLTVKKFFRLIKKKIETLENVKINYRELSTKYLGMKNKWYVNDRILDSFRFPDYVLPTASLNKFKKRLVEIFKEKSAFIELIIKLYKLKNPWSFKLTKHPDLKTDFFKIINTLEKAYWFGFLLAEAHFRKQGKNFRFSLGIGASDLHWIIKFGKLIGFDIRKLKYIRTVSEDGKISRIFKLDFSSAQFCLNLIKNGFPKSGKTHDPQMRFPIFSNKKLAMAMLLGFFDGDGSHHSKDPINATHSLNPIIKIHSRRFLEDIKDYFNIRNDIKSRGKYFELTIGTKLFNQLLQNFQNSLERKRHKYEGRMHNFKFSRIELRKLYQRGWYDQKIANYHFFKYGNKISRNTVAKYAKKWKLKKPTISIARWRVTIELLGKGWSLEEIYTKEFGYKYNPKNKLDRNRFISQYIKWFSSDPRVKDSDDILNKIVEVYGNVELTQKERVILRRKEGWSLEKIYCEELGYLYFNPSSSSHQYHMRKKFKEIFNDDPLIMNSGDILNNIREIYNPANKL